MIYESILLYMYIEINSLKFSTLVQKNIVNFKVNINSNYNL